MISSGVSPSVSCQEKDYVRGPHLLAIIMGSTHNEWVERFEILLHAGKRMTRASHVLSF